MRHRTQIVLFAISVYLAGNSYLQVVYLDDLGGNVRGAREVGMTAVRVRETEQALRELETLLGGVRLVDGAPQTGGLRLVDGAPQTEDSDRDNMIKSLL